MCFIRKKLKNRWIWRVLWYNIRNMWDVVADAALDGVKIFPFILLIYILMEVIEKVLRGPFAPAVASVLGAVPECGFAVMCAKLYDKGLIRIGTLIAAFLSVSDEGVIILISGGAITDALILIGIKIVFAVIVGEVLNLTLAKKDRAHVCPDKGDCIECGERHERGVDKYFLHPLTHALKTFAYVLVVNFILGTAIYFIGEENITEFMNKSSVVQPIIAAAVGLIPNCGSSIILAQAFTGGILSFAGLLAGLAANAGIGVLILLRSKKNFGKAFVVIGLQYFLAVALGYIVMAFAAL